MEVQTNEYRDVADVDNVLAGEYGAIFNQLVINAQSAKEQQDGKIMGFGGAELSIENFTVCHKLGVPTTHYPCSRGVCAGS